MARYLFTVWPFVGHINPFMSVALALKARGHEVAFYTSESTRAVVEPQGVVLFPFRHLHEEPIWAAVQAAETRATLGWHSPRLLLRAFRDWLAGTLPEQVADIREIVDEWRPDVIVTETGMWGPIVVLGETAPVPVAILTTLMGCLIPGPEAPPGGPGLPSPRNFRTRLLAKAVTKLGDVLAIGVRREVNRVRAANGLPPMESSVNAHMAKLPLYLIPSVREIDYDRHDLPPSVHYVGPCIWNKVQDAPAPAWLDRLPTDRPWVHVTEGTAHFQEPVVLKAAARGLADLPMQVVLTTGSQRDPDELGLGPIAPNIRVERWVSHSDLLPRCSVLVTTGGAGTVLTALQLGVPLIIVPTHWDKPDNARRVVEAGAGLRLTPRRCTPEGLRAAVERVLTEPSFRAQARRIAGIMAEHPGPDGAAALLESLAERSPNAARPATTLVH
ncbi:glycosyltransferase [Paludisphaera soli]|uniref:glycosyltransferase n=1 Tax=Paludisphaera soli TaxID=2712865 RepID=UPI0013EA1395|nr:nucleotide disphospho-sugar-binding domain-containing protein [Paludisphaera soli]